MTSACLVSAVTGDLLVDVLLFLQRLSVRARHSVLLPRLCQLHVLFTMTLFSKPNTPPSPGDFLS